MKDKYRVNPDGTMDIKSGNGKLTWRVEWAARWKIFGVTCEPFGKDHAASGGSYDVSSIISEEIFNYPAPYPVAYEWITLKGDAMSKSKGVFFTPGQWLEIGPAESLNYFLFRSKPLKHKDFSPEMQFLDFIEQFDRAEKIFFKEEPLSKIVLCLGKNACSKILGYKRINRMYDKLLNQYSDREKYVINSWPVYGFENEIQLKKNTEEYIDAKFEDMTAMIFKNYDEILTTIYGDYMKLPPKSKRIPKHSMTAWWRED